MLRRLLPLAAVLLLGWWLGIGYSGELTYRLQTEALLHGRLALQPTPDGLRYDWAWGNGVQQVWGLGMPLVRLPFDAVAKLLGADGFPDSLTFLVFYALVVLVVAGALRRRAPWEQAALLAVTVLSPAFVNLCRTRFEGYEEAVGGAFLVSLMLGALLLRQLEIATGRNLFLIAAVAGLAPLFRPTAIAYGGVALALALWVSRALPRRVLAGAVAIFALGLSILIVTNQSRFGSPVEFGHRLNLSFNALDRFQTHFGEPWQHEPAGRAAAELASALFQSRTPNGYDFLRAGLLPFQSPTPRFREFYFATFSPWMALALLLGWLTLFLRVREARLAALFSLATFAAEFVFYLRFHGLTSRYLVDFAVAVAFAMVALLLCAFHFLGERRSIALCALACGLTAWSIAGAWFGPVQKTRVLFSAAEVRDKLPHPPPGGAIRERRHCGEPREVTRLDGWGWGADCLVRTETQLFLPSRDCVHLRLGPLAGEPAVPAERARQVRVKRGLTELVKVRDVPLGSDRLLSFCAAPGAPRNPTGIEIVFIGWSDVAAAPGPLHRLLEVSAE